MSTGKIKDRDLTRLPLLLVLCSVIVWGLCGRGDTGWVLVPEGIWGRVSLGFRDRNVSGSNKSMGKVWRKKNNFRQKGAETRIKKEEEEEWRRGFESCQNFKGNL